MDLVPQRNRLRSTPRSATIRGRVDGFSPILRPLHVPSRAQNTAAPTVQTTHALPSAPKPTSTNTTIRNAAPSRPTARSTRPSTQVFSQKKSTPFTVSSPPIDTKPPRFAIKRRLVSRLVSGRSLTISLSVALILFSSYVSIDALWINHQAKAAQVTQQQNAENSTSSHIDETPLPPDSIKNYTVAPNLPRVIRIDTLGVEARVLRVGVTTDNAIDTPKNSNDAGWYDGSAKPGEAGAMIINAHYSGLTKPGIFHGLEKLKSGAIISIEKGDGKILRYAVDKIEKLPAKEVQMDQLFVSRKPNVQSLNLITCSGNFDPKTQTYDQRVIVHASAVK